MIQKVLSKRVVKYAVSGAISFLVENSSFWAFYYALKIGPVISSVSSIVVALFVNFYVTRNFVFSSERYLRSKREQFIRYIVVVFVNIFTSTFITVILIHFGAPGYVAKFIAAFCIAAWTYFIMKNVIFKTTKSDS